MRSSTSCPTNTRCARFRSNSGHSETLVGDRPQRLGAIVVLDQPHGPAFEHRGDMSELRLNRHAARGAPTGETHPREHLVAERPAPHAPRPGDRDRPRARRRTGERSRRCPDACRSRDPQVRCGTRHARASAPATGCRRHRCSPRRRRRSSARCRACRARRHARDARGVAALGSPSRERARRAGQSQIRKPSTPSTSGGRDSCSAARQSSVACVVRFGAAERHRYRSAHNPQAPETGRDG